MNTIFSFLLVLGLLIFVHEFGHFIAAKLFRVKVLKFSLGFGPKLVGKQFGETEYLIGAFPLGGYVKMLGEQPGEEVSEAEARQSFSYKPVWQRMTIVFWGPFFNLLFAVFVFFCIYATYGLPTPVNTTQIGSITENSPAAKAGLAAGDIILSIDGVPMQEWQDISEYIKNSSGKELSLEIGRDKQVLELKARPEESETKNIFGEITGKRYLLGIARSDEVVYEKVSIMRAITAGFEQTWLFIYLTVVGIVKIIQNVVPASEIGGPILIASVAGQQLEAGWINLFSFMGVLSVNLGIINLFPIPILDGGHLVFFSVEAIRRKPVSIQTQEIFQQIGLVILGTLMIFVFYNDIARVISHG